VSTLCIASGSRRAELLRRRDALVESHLDLARSIARGIARTLPATFELDDLTQTAYLGLLKAATNYRPRAHGNTPFEAYCRPVVRGAILDSVRRRHYVENTRPGITELVCTISADREAELDAGRRSAALDRAVEALPARSRLVVECHYEGEMRLTEVGRRLGVGKSRASQLHCEAIGLLRNGAELVG
jgi:RNA polymerase sigma factor (sigma-70 family)